MLEDVHRELLDRACAGVMPANIATSISGSRITSDNLPFAQEILKECFERRKRAQYEHDSRLQQPLVAHNQQENMQFEEMYKDLQRALRFEATHFNGFEPREFELRFGFESSGDERVEYAGVPVVGRIDRMDIDAGGRAIIIDYKYKSSLDGFDLNYEKQSGTAPAQDNSEDEKSLFQLPQHIQSLMYAQVVRRLYPDLEVVGSLYFSLKGKSDINGAVSEASFDRIFGNTATSGKRNNVIPERLGCKTFYELLDKTEDAIAQRIDGLLCGEIVANPAYTSSCTYCPVLRCEKKRS